MAAARAIAIIGLGYVGLPVAAAFARRYPGTIGFDIDAGRIAALGRGEDWTNEVTPADLAASGLRLTDRADDLRQADVFIVCVPTPLHPDRTPNLDPLRSASEIVGSVLRPGALVVYESTVYPGLTEDVCGEILARVSGLRLNQDFHLGYSPERINPGDKQHRFQTITKVIASSHDAATELMAELYGSVVDAGVHRAASIKVAELAKVIENTQRDLNIALMNELAIICDRIGVRTRDVIDTASTKWNFLSFRPGLVGGHCVGVDPYYLATKANDLGCPADVILAARRVNESMGAVIVRKVAALLASAPTEARKPRIAVLGVTFKENVPDIRNSGVPAIADELQSLGFEVVISDPLANPLSVSETYGLRLAPFDGMTGFDGVILATPHQFYLDNLSRVWSLLNADGILIDVASAVSPGSAPPGLRYWSL